MIKLEKYEYCENCGYFEPEVNIYAVSALVGETQYNTYIKCKNSEKCRHIYDRMKAEDRMGMK